MRYVPLGRTGLQVSELGFGTWTISTGWWGEVDEAKGVALLRRAHELGVSFFDAADTYGNGYGEEILARAFAGVPRDRLVYATKFGYDFYNHPTRGGHAERPHDFSPEFVRFALKQSLRRLGTDYIDVYQLHNPRLQHIRDDRLFETLSALKREGKIRFVGVALGPAIGWREEGIAALRERGVDVLHIIHNLLEQDPGDELLALARETGAGAIVRVPHSSGLLEGKYTLETTFDANDHRSHRKRQWLVEGLQKLERLRFLTEGRDLTIGQAALRWVWAQPQVAVALPNLYNAEQLEEFAAASDKPDLTPADLARVEALYHDNFGLARAGA